MDALATVFQLIMLLLLFVTLAVRSILLYTTQRVNPFVLGKGKKGVRAVIECGFFVGLLIWAFEIVSCILHLPVHLFPGVAYVNLFSIPWVGIIGMVLIVSGYVLFVLSLVSFGNSWRIGIDKDHPGKLVTTGIFSFTRNPIFVYIDLYFIGTALIQPSVFFILAVVAAVGGIHLQILQEEKYLESRFGDEYRVYKRRVGRYV